MITLGLILLLFTLCAAIPENYQQFLGMQTEILQLCQKSDKLFKALADSKNAYYDPENHVLGNSYFSKNVYSRQTYVANGYIGARLSTLGQGFAYDEINTYTDIEDKEVLQNGWPLFNRRYTGAFVAGFYSLQERLADTNFPELYERGYDSVISSLPYWVTLDVIYEKGGKEYVLNPQSTLQAEISSYQQNMSMKNGVVTTRFVWLEEIEVTIEALAHKQLLPLGLVTMTLKPLAKDIQVKVRDVLNFSTSQRTALSDIGSDRNGIYIEVNPDNVPYSSAAIFSSLDIEGANASMLDDTTIINEAEVDLKAGQSREIHKYVGVVSSEFKEHNCGSELNHAMKIVQFAKSVGRDKIFEAHDKEWCSQFEETDIDIPSDALLTLAARSSLYHLLANTQVNSRGLTSALSTAGLSSDSYGGMVFWDTDLWIIPALAPFAPKLAKAVSNYRNYTRDQAIENARSYGYEGAAYPWTSGRFGNCTSSGPCIDYEYHINVDVALSSWLIYISGETEDYLRYTTWPLLRDASDFLSQYTTFDNKLKKFVTKNLTDPDEYANHVDNGAFTNAGIDSLLKVTLLVAKHLGEPINPRWIEVNNNIYMPVSKHGIVLEYSGMNASVLIKQADVVLLTFPLEYVTDLEQAQHNLFYYSLKQADVGPAMTFPVFTVVSARLLDYGCSSQSYLQRSVFPYVRSPFAQFSEQADDNILTNGGTHPGFPFLTGHGGFLQAIIYGILGLQYSSRLNETTGKLERYLKYDPTQLKSMPGGLKVNGFKYMNQILDIVITDDEGVIFHKGDEPVLIKVQDRKGRPGGDFTIQPGDVFRVPAYIPGKNMEGSMTECHPIANLTAGSPGEVALSAVDGNNYTYWKPLTREPAKLLIDLQENKKLTHGLIVWGARPAKYFSLYVVDDDIITEYEDILINIDYVRITKIVDSYPIKISQPFDEKYLKEVKLLPNNETYFEIPDYTSQNSRYVILEVVDAIDEQGLGGATINEVALFDE